MEFSRPWLTLGGDEMKAQAAHDSIHKKIDRDEEVISRKKRDRTSISMNNQTLSLLNFMWLWPKNRNSD